MGISSSLNVKPNENISDLGGVCEIISTLIPLSATAERVVETKRFLDGTSENVTIDMFSYTLISVILTSVMLRKEDPTSDKDLFHSRLRILPH